jgi:hypothetical protein
MSPLRRKRAGEFQVVRKKGFALSSVCGARNSYRVREQHDPGTHRHPDTPGAFGPMHPSKSSRHPSIRLRRLAPPAKRFAHHLARRPKRNLAARLVFTPRPDAIYFRSCQIWTNTSRAPRRRDRIRRLHMKKSAGGPRRPLDVTQHPGGVQQKAGAVGPVGLPVRPAAKLTPRRTRSGNVLSKLTIP